MFASTVRMNQYWTAQNPDDTLAYQSALLSVPLLLIRMLVSLLQFPQFLRTTFTVLVIIPSLYMAYVHLFQAVVIISGTDVRLTDGKRTWARLVMVSPAFSCHSSVH